MSAPHRLLAAAHRANYDKSRLVRGRREIPCLQILTRPRGTFMARTLSLISAVGIVLAGLTSLAQDAMLEDLYGRGVHAYFSGNLPGSFDALNTAIKSGCRDPRAFYYRGLVLNRFGRPDEARDDFRKGAELEMLGGEPYPVGKSLERVQ